MRRSATFPYSYAVWGTQSYFSFLLQCCQFKEAKVKKNCSDIWVGSSVHIFFQKRLSAQKDHDFISFGDTILQNFLQFQNHYRLQSTLAPSGWRHPRQPPETGSGCQVWSLPLLLWGYVECLGLCFYIDLALPIKKGFRGIGLYLYEIFI